MLFFKFKKKTIKKRNIKPWGYTNETKFYSQVGCLMDETISGKAKALNIKQKINNKLKLFYRKKDALILTLRHLLCNKLIQPHFYNVCSAWYPNMIKKLKP